MANERFEQGGDKRELTDIIYIVTICHACMPICRQCSPVYVIPTREPACMTHNYLLCTTPLDQRQ